MGYYEELLETEQVNWSLVVLAEMCAAGLTNFDEVKKALEDRVNSHRPES